jgi:hypothetical protein
VGDRLANFLATYGGFGAALAVMTLGSGPSGLLELPLTLSFVLISGLRAAFDFPAELSANWAFQIGETDRAAEYQAATRKSIAICAILPLFAALAPMEFACFPPAAGSGSRRPRHRHCDPVAVGSGLPMKRFSPHAPRPEIVF